MNAQASPRGTTPQRRSAGPWMPVACALCIACLMPVLGGCAHLGSSRTRPVSIDSRPTPPQPGSGDSMVGGAGNPSQVPTSPAESAQKRIAADTLATNAVLDRCGRRKLLPEQESTVDAARQLLVDTRAAIARGALTRAESLARQARQLTSSLNCP